MRLTHSLAMLLVGTPVLLLVRTQPVHAQAAEPAPAEAAAAIAAAPPVAQAAPAAFGRAADAGVLAEQRGGSDLVKNDMQLSGVTADNVAHNVSTGANSIAGGSFSGASGLPIVIQNSGANVLIQNATILNLHMQ
ncbi:MAG: hypothetical protein PGN26_00800 [Xylophilus ampelinus]